jgi:CYTH domain-containing protein
MSQEIEIEKTYLAKFLPANLKKCKSKQLIDIYLPKKTKHAKLRIRKSGDTYTITKKQPVSSTSASIQLEESVSITAAEYQSLAKLDGNKIQKIRYYYSYNKQTAEIDVFAGKLKGLVLIDFEFRNQKELKDFKMPNFCLVEVTEEEAIAGGVLSQHSMSSLKKTLAKYSYKKVIM